MGRYTPPVTRTATFRAMDGLLAEQDFERHGSTWVRARGLFFDVVDVQRGRLNDGVTVNVGLFHAPTYELAWGEPPTFPLSEPECIVRARLGFLLDGRDRWWPPDDRSAVADMTEALNSAALPFLANFKELGHVERWLDASKANRYPPEALYLAAIKHQRDKVEEARGLVEQLLQRTTSEPWRDRICCMSASFA